MQTVNIPAEGISSDISRYYFRYSGFGIDLFSCRLFVYLVLCLPFFRERPVYTVKIKKDQHIEIGLFYLFTRTGC